MNDAAADRSSVLPASPRLLAVRLSALGDVIHTIPAVLSLCECYDVTWVVEAPYRELVELVAGVAAVPVRMKTWTGEPKSAIAAVRAMRGFDIAVDFQGLIIHRSLCMLAVLRLANHFATGVPGQERQSRHGESALATRGWRFRRTKPEGRERLRRS